MGDLSMNYISVSTFIPLIRITLKTETRVFPVDLKGSTMLIKSNNENRIEIKIKG